MAESCPMINEVVPEIELNRESVLQGFFHHLCRNPLEFLPENAQHIFDLSTVRRVLIRKRFSVMKKKRQMDSNSGPVNAAVGSGELTRSERRKRCKTIERCSSPSHFNVDDVELAKFGPAFLQEIPERAKVDEILKSVSKMYYTPKETTNDRQAILVDSAYDKAIYPTIDSLISPLRKTSVWETWSPKEIALFESGICAFGKDFHQISKLIQSKDSCECVDFYYNWKKSAHYQMWKEYGKPQKPLVEGRPDQWKAIAEKMKGF